MVAPLVILAAATAIQSAVGGLIGASNARKRAAYASKLYEQQALINDMIYSRKIREDVGADIASAAARGVAQTGSVTASIMNEAFGTQLQRVIRSNELRMQGLQSSIGGQQQAQSSILSGLAGSLQAGYQGLQAQQTQNAIDAAKRDQAGTKDVSATLPNKPVAGPPVTYGPPV